MRLGFSMGLRQSHRQSLRLTLAMRHQLHQYLLELRLDLIETIRGLNYRPEATCPSCGHRLTLGEILRGFTADPQDLTTACPRCQARFAPKMVCRDNYSSVEIPFYCAVQVLDMLDNVAGLSPEELRRLHPAVYHSAVFHHGTLQQAFGRADILYAQPEELDWSEKVIPFLGRLPDTEIAACVGQPVRVVRNRRRQLNIAAFSKRAALDEL